APLREWLVEVGEGQHRDAWVVALVPEVRVRAVEVLPQRLVRARRRGVDARRPGLRGDLRLDLLDRRRQIAAVAQPNVDREVVLAPQAREESRAQQRSLAQAGEAEEEREARGDDAAIECLDLLAAAAEEALIVLAERRQRRPWMLALDVQLRAAPARSAFPAFLKRRTSLRTSSIPPRSGPSAS